LKETTADIESFFKNLEDLISKRKAEMSAITKEIEVDQDQDQDLDEASQIEVADSKWALLELIFSQFDEDDSGYLEVRQALPCLPPHSNTQLLT